MASPGEKADGTGRSGSSTTAIEAPMLQAAARGLNSIKGGDLAWMGAGDPMPAGVPGAAGRQYDFPVATNLNIRPRAGELVSFGDLRALSDAYYLIRLAIETRKDQLVKLCWAIKPTDDTVKPDQRCKDLTKFFKKPDMQNGWQEWLRMLVEDMLAIDAACVYYRENLGNKPFAFEIMDGATIKVLLDKNTGRRPAPPDPAYQQNLKGIPAVNYTSEELVYRPRNPRSWKAYGYSPVEQVIMIVNIGLRRSISQLQFYTEGNIPEALIGTPNTWNPDQIKAYQAHWDALFEGNTANRRHAKFVPGGMDIHETKSATLTDAFDEWLARVVQYCFSLPATPYVKQVNKGETTNMKEQAEEEGLTPLMTWVKDFMNYLIFKYWGYEDLEFDWTEEKSIDPLIQAQIDQIYITTDVVEKNEVRAALGLEARDYEAEAATKMKAQQDAGIDPATGKPAQKTPDGKDGKAPPPDDKKDGGIKNKVENPDVKKKTFAKLGTANIKQVKKLAGVFKRHFKKIKPDVVKQVVAAYGKLTKADETAKITEKLDFDFTAVLTLTAKNLNDAAQTGVDDAAMKLDELGQGEFDFGEIAAGVGDYNAAELVKNIDDSTRDMLASDIDDALKEGWTTDELAGVIEDNYAFSEARAETIARTEIARADMDGSMKAYRESGVVAGKKWLLAEDPCPICEENANDGIIDLEENFSSGDDAAPAHPNCFLEGTSVTAFGVTRAYKRWFQGKIITISVDGKTISITPNHPILTTSGFVPAKNLKVGDCLFQWDFPTVTSHNPNNDYIETAIENIADSLLMAGGSASPAMPTSAEHFHGDGIPNGEVDIVNSTCLLNGDVAKTINDIQNLSFGNAQWNGIDLPCRRSLEHLTVGNFSTSDNSMCTKDSGSAHFFTDQQRFILSSLGKALNRQASRDKSLPDGGAMTTQSGGDGCATFPVSVKFINIVNITELDFSGHVYNLETVNGWFIAESIITSNCECDVSPVVGDAEEEETD